MHILSFLQKRTHLCAVARGREMFAHVAEITPARFDILHLIFKHLPRPIANISGYSMPQAAITRALGLTRQTVWKAVERLIELGLVEKYKASARSRLNMVRLTEEGLRRAKQAIHTAFSETKPANQPGPEQPATTGREVERIYTSFAWRQVRPGGRRGRRGRRDAQLQMIEDMAEFAYAMAAALGNEVRSIYTNRYIERSDI